MEKIVNGKAIHFYNELLAQGIVEKNEEMRDRLSEVINWHHAFVVLIQHASHFRIKVLEREKMIQLAKAYSFEPGFIKSLSH